MIRPSASSISDKLDLLRSIAETIEDCLLIGEKIECIVEGGEVFNDIRSLVTPEYLTDAEYEWMCDLGKTWNDECERYAETNKDVIESRRKTFEDELNQAIDDMINGIEGHDDRLE